jgi:fibronectin-binding autotransporter adhesin
MFLQGSGQVTFAPGAGQVQQIDDVIADQTGVHPDTKGMSYTLIKNGAGTTILTAANQYSGGVEVLGGTLQGNASSLVGDILDNASLVFVQATDATYKGALSGQGLITKNGAGSLTLMQSSEYVGGATVNAGALNLGKTDLTGPVTVNAGALTLGGGSSVSGAVNLSGGAFTLGANSFVSGAVNLSAGALTLASGGISGAVSLNGGLLGFGPGGGAVSGPVTIAAPSGALNVAAGGSVLVSGVVSGNQLVKQGAGSVQLDAANTFEGLRVEGGLVQFTNDGNLGAPGSVQISGGGAVGTTADTPANFPETRDIQLLGSGGLSVALHPLIWSGAISGAGQFIKSGGGQLELTGANTYAGGTLINAGTLAIGSDNVLGAPGTGVTMANSTALRATNTFATTRQISLSGRDLFIVDSDKTLTLDGTVSGGAGELVKLGTGTLLVSNERNSYSSTTIDQGTVQGNAKSIRGNITFSTDPNNLVPRSVTFDQRFDGTFGGAIAGFGSLLKTNLGALTLTGTNTYTDGTIVEGGSLVGTSLSLQGNIINKGLVAFNQSFDGLYAGNLVGSGIFNKAGVGKLNITGNDQAGNGTNINGGTLAVNGTLNSGVIVNTGGTLAGSGLITGKVTLNGGTDERGMNAQIDPGNSIGALHILGDLAMAPASEYQVQINGASGDEIQVDGTAAIQSSTFEIERYNTGASPVVPGKTYTIVTTTDGLSVVAPTVAIADFPFISFALSEDGFNGYLTTSRSAERFADLASTPNEAAVANALDTATSSLAWQQVVGASTADARAAFASLSNASIHASAAGVLSEQSHFLRDAVLDRLRQDFPMSDSPAPADSVLSYTENKPVAPAVAALPTRKAPAVVAPLGPVYTVWAQGLGSWGSLSGNSNVARTNDSIGGVISGIDVTFNRMFRLGFAGGYSQSNFNSANIPASGSADSYHFAVYGGWQEGPWALRGGGSVSWNDLNTSRQVTAVSLGGQQTSSYADKTWQGFVEGARNFAFGPAALEPFANVAYVHVGGDVSESGLAAMTGSTSFDTTYTTLGAHGSYLLPAGLTAQATLGWRYAFGDVTPLSTLGFQSGGAAFALAGSPIARNALVTELGVNYAHRPLRHDWRRLFRPIFRRGQRKLRQGESHRAVLRGMRRTISAPILLNRAAWNVRFESTPLRNGRGLVRGAI